MKIRGYTSRKSERDRQAWEQARAVSFYSFLPHAKNKKMSLYQFWPFPWEKKEKIATMDEAGRKKKLAEIVDRHKKTLEYFENRNKIKEN